MFRNSGGFTLIELMIVVVIIGIMASIAVPNFIAMQDRAKEASVKSNCHLVQLVVEDYAVRHNGRYPAEVSDFVGDLPGGALLTNPFTKLVDQPQDQVASSVGVTGYEPMFVDGNNVGYTISGFGKRRIIITMESTD